MNSTLFAGRGSCLSVEGCWLIRRVVADGWGGCGNFRKPFANKDLYSQSYGFSSRHIWMWELDHKEYWDPKNWCFWNVVLEKTLESPLDCTEIKPVNPKENQPWLFNGRTEAEAPILWLPDANSWLIRKDPDAGKERRQEEKGTTEDEMVGWHHRLNGHEFKQAPKDGERQGSLASCSPWGCRVGHNWATITKGHNEVCCSNWPFHEQFLHSTRCCLIVFYPR